MMLILYQFIVSEIFKKDSEIKMTLILLGVRGWLLNMSKIGAGKSWHLFWGWVCWIWSWYYHKFGGSWHLWWQPGTRCQKNKCSIRTTIPQGFILPQNYTSWRLKRPNVHRTHRTTWQSCSLRGTIFCDSGIRSISSQPFSFFLNCTHPHDPLSSSKTVMGVFVEAASLEEFPYILT